MKSRTPTSRRLEELYRRRMVPGELAARQFPAAFLAREPLLYVPARPEIPDYDILEIGPGHGDFLFHMARKNPDKKILGIEMGKHRFAGLVARRRELKADNVTLVRGDARVPLANDLRRARFEKVFVLFPDPWPRNRHRYRRLLSLEFLAALCVKLRTGGVFTLATDVADYKDWVAGHLARFPFLEALPDASAAGLIPTYFEKKWKRLGRTCHYARYIRV